MESGYIARGHTRLYWEAHGSGDDVLFLHAGVADSRMWRHQMHLEGWRSIVFDQRGFGRTAWVADGYSDWEDAVAVLDEAVVQAAVVVGCSLGGSIALQLALAAPERVRGLVLIGAAAGGWAPEDGWAEDPMWEEALAAGEAGDQEKVLDIDTRMWLAGYGRTVEDIDPELVELFRDMDRTPIRTESERDQEVVRFGPTADRLSEIAIPALIAVGVYDAPDLITSAEFLAASISDARKVEITDAAHLPSLEQPEQFNRHLNAFLRSI